MSIYRHTDLSAGYSKYHGFIPCYYYTIISILYISINNINFIKGMEILVIFIKCYNSRTLFVL